MRSTFFHYKDLTVLTLLTFPLPEAFLLLVEEMLIVLVMLNPISGSTQESPFDLTLLTLLTFLLPEYFFESMDLTLLTFPL